MKMRNCVLSIIALASVISFRSDAYLEFCKNYSKINIEAASYFDSVVPFDLLSYLQTETNLVINGRKSNDPSFAIINKTIDALATQPRPLSISRVRQELNNQTLMMLEKYTPNDPYDRRLDFLTEDFVRAALRSIERHPIVSSSGMRKYDQKGTEIGYCFGRALYIDLILARLGVDQDSIKKIWAVGPMSSGNINWQFHVGTMVRLKDNRWVVIDNVVGSVVDARTWHQHFLKQNREKDLRVFVTDSNKFTPSIGNYTRGQLGLDMLPSRDWYKGYFADMMAWFKEHQDDAKFMNFLGIAKMPDRPLTGAALAELVARQQAEQAAKLAKEEEERRARLQEAYGIDFTTGDLSK